MWNNQKSNCPDCIVNLSNKNLNLSECNALRFGLGHHILPKRIDEMSVKAQIESQIQRLCKHNEVELSFDNKTNIRDATSAFIQESKSICGSRKNKAIHNTLNSLSRNNKIRLLKMDKGVGVVIMNTQDYISKLDVIVNDDSRFRKIDYNIELITDIEQCELAPWIARERSIANYIRNYIKPMVDEPTYWKLLPRGSQPGKLYGMAKNHKANCPLRPVLSAINTAEYAICKWFETEIKPFYNSKWSVTSTQSFIEDLNSIKPCQSDVCVSFDIKSLYTNVPLNEVIDDVADVLYNDKSDSIFKTHLKKLTKQKKQRKKQKKKQKEQKILTKRVFKNFLKQCSKSMFLYNGHVYQQTDGLAMGSPLAPILANWFVSKIESKLLEDTNIKQPKFYKRYVDDIFAVFHCETDKNEFFTHLNNAHKNLQFTMEEMCNTSRSLPFLDVNIRINPSNEFETSVYRKPTNTGVLLNYEAVAPKKWKKSVIKGFLVRAKRISSSQELLNREIAHIQNTFAKNGYPKSFINNIIDEFFKDEERRKKEIINDTDTNSSPLKRAYFVLPYIGKATERLHKRVSREMLQHNIDLKAAYRTTKVGSYMSTKQKVPDLLRNDVVYEFQCSCDKNIRYIGETERHLFTRIFEHCSIKSNEKPKPSAIRDHMLGCDTCASAKNIADNFSILRTCTSFDILSQEALCIKKFKPLLNVQLGIYRGSRVPSNIYS